MMELFNPNAFYLLDLSSTTRFLTFFDGESRRTQIHRLLEGGSIFAHFGDGLQLQLWVRTLLGALCGHQMRLKKTFPRINA
jgi:hypothetical protein